MMYSHLHAQSTEAWNELNQMIVSGIADWKIPGLAAVVVKDGEVVFQEVYGVKNLETQAPIDGNTLFNMGSTTKAIICIALGMLVDQGELDWHDPVTKHIPSFTLSDPYITQEIRVKDLLTHNAGIQAADLLWFLDSLSTEATISKFAYSPKGYPIRGDFDYNNLMYAVAGEVIHHVSGQHWTQYVKENIFKPLQMSKTKARANELFDDGNFVTPYLDDIEDGMMVVNYNLSDQIGAAGMIWSCANDVANYLQFLVGGGVFNSDTLLQPETFQFLFEPHSFVPDHTFYPTRTLTQPNWQTYGLGWFQHDYQGEKLDFHTGSIAGLVAICGILHEKDVAVYVFANLDHAELRHAILYKALDIYAFNDVDGRNWHEEIFKLYQNLREQTKVAISNQRKTRQFDTTPTLELSEYQGTYYHDMLGRIEVQLVGNHLELDFNEFVTFTARHWHYNTFRSEQNSRYKLRTMFHFNLNPAGKVEELEGFGEVFQKK